MKPIELVTLTVVLVWAIYAVLRAVLAPLGQGPGKCATCGDSCGCAPKPQDKAKNEAN